MPEKGGFAIVEKYGDCAKAVRRSCTCVQVGVFALVAARGARTDIVLLHCRLSLQRIADVDFAITPFGLAFEQWQPLTIAGVLFGALRVRPIRLSAFEYHREIVVVRVSIHAIAVTDYEVRSLPGFKRMGLPLDELSELGFHPCFNAKTSDGYVSATSLILDHLAERLTVFVEEWNAHAHPFNWSTQSVAKVIAKCEREAVRVLAA